MINSDCPKSAVVERIGSDSVVFARQICAVVSGNFRNILSKTRASQLGEIQEIKCLAPKMFSSRSRGKPLDALYETLHERAKATAWHFIIGKCLESWLYLNKGDRNIAGKAVFFTCDTGSDYWQLPIASKKLARAVRLLSPKADFLRSNVTLLANPPLSKEFQGESR